MPCLCKTVRLNRRLPLTPWSEPRPAFASSESKCQDEKKIEQVAHRVNNFLSDAIGIRVRRDRPEWQPYDKDHEQEALAAVRTIEKFNGQKLLPSQKKLADEYSINILGNKVYAPWLYVYTLVRGGNFKEGWIPDNFFWEVSCTRNKQTARHYTL
jgi:hypothetical protein